jgi:hypothetical protein
MARVTGGGGMTKEHTPGPLSFYYDGPTSGNFDYCVKNDTTGTVVAWTCTEPNARLMAIAPEMLRALIKTTFWIEKNFEPTKEMEENISIIEQATGKTWDELKELL